MAMTRTRSRQLEPGLTPDQDVSRKRVECQEGLTEEQRQALYDLTGSYELPEEREPRTLAETFTKLAENAHAVYTLAWLGMQAAKEERQASKGIGGYYTICKMARTMSRKDAEYRTWRHAAKLAQQRGA